jgi:hypothetical protein
MVIFNLQSRDSMSQFPFNVLLILDFVVNTFSGRNWSIFTYILLHNCIFFTLFAFFFVSNSRMSLLLLLILYKIIIFDCPRIPLRYPLQILLIAIISLKPAIQNSSYLTMPSQSLLSNVLIVDNKVYFFGCHSRCVVV